MASAGTFGPPWRSDEFHRADEAGGITGRKQLLGIVAGATAAAEFLRGRELDVERAVEGCGGAITAAGGLGAGLVEHVHGHVGLPWVCRFDEHILHTIRLCTI